jgi:hypothetical protein
VVAHAAGTRREHRQVGAALALDAQLCAFDAVTDFIIADDQRVFRRTEPGVFQAVDLLLAEGLERFGGGGVVSVTVDDQEMVSVLKDGRRIAAKPGYLRWRDLFRGDARGLDDRNPALFLVAHKGQIIS